MEPSPAPAFAVATTVRTLVLAPAQARSTTTCSSSLRSTRSWTFRRLQRVSNYWQPWKAMSWVRPVTEDVSAEAVSKTTFAIGPHMFYTSAARLHYDATLGRHEYPPSGSSVLPPHTTTNAGLHNRCDSDAG